MLIVLVLPGILFPPKKAVKRTGGQAVGDTGRAADTARTPAPRAESVAGAFLSVCPPVRPPAAVATLAETIWVSARHARFGFSPAGAQLVSAELLDYKSFAPGDSERPVQLVPAGRSMLAHCLVVGADTISLADWHFTPSVPALAFEENQPRFGGGIAVGGPVTVTTSSFFSGTSGVPTRTALALTLPVPPGGDFRYELYTGPLEYRQLAHLGHDLDDANPYGGVLVPLPVLFGVFFVFAHTSEVRGVAFLWLPDLSRADPYYIIPIIMGLSMFVLSKVGQIGVPPNPQAKTMLYFMPVFMTLLLLRFASGLNLYYAVSNIFSIPQQYLIARRRLREQGKRT